MKIRFRGGPKHNTSYYFSKLDQYIFMAENLPLTFEDVETANRDCKPVEIEYIRHRYQLGKDKNGKQFYFYIGV